MKLKATLNDNTIVNVINLYVEQGYLEYCNIGMQDYARVNLSDVKYFDFLDEDNKIINNKILKECLEFFKKQIDKEQENINKIKINAQVPISFTSVIPEIPYDFYNFILGL